MVSVFSVKGEPLFFASGVFTSVGFEGLYDLFGPFEPLMSTTTVEVEFTLFAINPSVTVQLIPSFVLKLQVAPVHETELLETDSFAIILFENKYAKETDNL